MSTTNAEGNQVHANKIVLVTRRTRLEELIARHNTPGQARFYIEHLGADYVDYETEHRTYQAAIRTTEEQLVRFGRVQRLDRAFLSNFIFPEEAPVVVLGQDGLVANTLKYLAGQQVVGVNPDPSRWDGVLLPFRVTDLSRLMPEVLSNRRLRKTVTMAQASLSDGQTLFAVNDLFIGVRSHVSARYEIALGKTRERHSSSGVIVSTGLGSSGWFRSVLTGAMGIAGSAGQECQALRDRGFAWDTRHLYFSVREPFPSRATQTSLVLGRVTDRQPLELVSQMPENGVIFSDGIEGDCLEFTSGMHATIQPAARQGVLVH